MTKIDFNHSSASQVFKKVILFFVCLFQDRVSLCNPMWPGTHYVEKPGWS